MQSPIINATNEMLLGAVKRIYQRKEITLEQYATSLRRSFLKTSTPKDSANYPSGDSNTPLPDGFSDGSIPKKVTSFSQKVGELTLKERLIIKNKRQTEKYNQFLNIEGIDYVE